MSNKAVTVAVSLSLTLLGGMAQSAPVDKTNTLPDAKPGQCYAKVMIPAKYETTTEEVLVREESEKIESVPAQYKTVEEKIMVQEGWTKLEPVPTVYDVVTERIETQPAQTLWVSNLGKRGIPVNFSMVNSAKAAGADTENAIPGMCFREYYQPAQFNTETEEVLVSEAAEKIEIIPATYEWVEEQVLIKEAAKKIVEVPATYETITEQVLLEPAKTVWKKGSGPVERIDHTTGEIMCLVEIPAVYKTVTKNVVKTPATAKEIEIPAVYKTVKVRKLKTPEQEKRIKIPATHQTINKQVKIADAKFNWHPTHDTSKPEGRWTGNQICLKEIPAKFETIKKQVVKTAASVQKEEVPAVHDTFKLRKLVAEAKEVRTKIPAKYKTVTKRKKVNDESLEWRPVLCQTNMTRDIVRRVQEALLAAGYKPGTADGIAGGATMRAIDAYQQAKGLPRGGLTIRTLESLGVQL